MDLQRLFLFLIFSMSVVLLWDGWQRYQHPAAPVVASAAATNTAPGAVPTPGVTAAPAAAATASDVAKVEPVAVAGQKITVKTDFLRAEISTQGGDLRRLELSQHRDAGDMSKPFAMMQKHGDHTYYAQTGLLGPGLPNHTTLFEGAAADYTLAEGKDTLEVRLPAPEVNGVKVTKVYVFHRGSYVIDVGYEVENDSAAAIAPSAYFQFLRDSSAPEGSSRFLPTYTGAAVYTEADKFKKVEFDSITKGKAEYPKTANDGWIGMLQHYFVAAWLPKQQTPREYYAKQGAGGLFQTGVIQSMGSIAPGQKTRFTEQLYVGPAESSLDEVAPGLGLTVDYGWLTVIATPLFWVMTKLHGIVLNWGIAIILLTVLIKLAFFPLSAASYRSMAKMRVVAPKLEQIKKQYGDDRERLQKAMMELYSTEKINPLGGCLPVLIQIPVFIALYWSILASVELRHAPFFGWITDLSSPDPYYVLPVIMGLSMIIQTKLNPQPPDPMQAKIMQAMPVIFSVMFFFFPAGLVLYSIVNNVLSIAQQWVITRKMEAKPKGAANDA